MRSKREAQIHFAMLFQAKKISRTMFHRVVDEINKYDG